MIDVGVAFGTPELYEAFPQARHVLVEPLGEYTHALREIEQRYRAESVLAAAGPKRGTTTISVHRAPALSSVLGEWKGQSGDSERREVPMVALDDLLEERGLRAPFVLKVDVEGGELLVLDGASRLLDDAELVLLEVNFFQFVPGAAEFAEVIAYMKERGFVAYDFYTGHLRPLDEALAVVNVAFVKEDGRFRTTHDFATAEQTERMLRSWGY